MSHPTASWTLTSSATTAEANVPGSFLPGVDLHLGTDGDLTIDTDLSFTRGLDAITQGVRLRIRLFMGEWFLNLDAGVPWWQDILGQKFDEVKVRAAFRDALINSPGVEEIDTLEISFSAATRILRVNWVVITNLEGAEITDKIDFVI